MKWILIITGVALTALFGAGIYLTQDSQSSEAQTSQTEIEELTVAHETADTHTPSTTLPTEWHGKTVDQQLLSDEELAGYDVFATYCVACHGAFGEGTEIGVPLNRPEVWEQDLADLMATISNGVPDTAMPSWSAFLEPTQIEAVAHFLHEEDVLRVERPFSHPTPPETTNVALLDAALFNTTCATCHGEDGSGDEGPALNSLNILTKRTDDEIASIIHDGGWHMNSIMPAFGESLTTEQIDSLVAYIRAWEETAVWVDNPRGTAQSGGPAWQQANWTGGQGMGAGAGQGQGQGKGRSGQGGGGPWWQNETP